MTTTTSHRRVRAHDGPVDTVIDLIGAGLATVFFIGCVPGWWWGGGGPLAMPIVGEATRHTWDLIVEGHNALPLFPLALYVFGLFVAAAGGTLGVFSVWCAAADIARGINPRDRYRSVPSPKPCAAPRSDPSRGWVEGPACAVAHGIDNGYDSPLLEEMTAIRLHTVQLHHLTAHEQHRETYQQMARIQIGHLLAGWQQQTGGEGSLEDLLPRNHALKTPTPDGVPVRESLPTVSAHAPGRAA